MTEILDRLASQIYSMNRYPNHKQITEEAEAVSKANLAIEDCVCPSCSHVWINIQNGRIPDQNEKLRMQRNTAKWK